MHRKHRKQLGMLGATSPTLALLSVLDEAFPSDYGFCNDTPLTGCEVGVDVGNTASWILRWFFNSRLHLVDAWKDNRMGYRTTVYRMREFGDRAHISRGWSVDIAATMLKDGLRFDFVYVDADHSYDGTLADISAWWPLLKPGGVLAGDDFNPCAQRAKWQGARQAFMEAVSAIKKDGHEVLANGNKTYAVRKIR